MKKILRCGSIIIGVFLTITSPAFAQELGVNTKGSEKIISVPATVDQGGEVRYINDVNGRVLKSFYRSFGEKPGIKWSKNKEGFVAFFKEKNIATNVYLTANGTIEYVVKHYTEAELPKNIRHIVRSRFYDDSIIHVAEVKKEDIICFFVKLEGKGFVKTVKVVDEECEIVENFAKQ